MAQNKEDNIHTTTHGKSPSNILKDLRLCKHEKPVEKIQGRKKKFLFLICSDCGLVLDIKEMRKHESSNRERRL